MFVDKTVCLIVILVKLIVVSPETSPSGAEEAIGEAEPGVSPAPVEPSNGDASTEYEHVVMEKPTDIPQSDIDDALFLEDGDFSTVSFQTHNDRFIGWHQRHPPGPFGYVCNDDYVRCMLAHGIMQPICAVHKLGEGHIGVRNLNNMCDLHHYNCRRGFRYFFVMKYGLCGYKSSYSGINLYYHPIHY